MTGAASQTELIGEQIDEFLVEQLGFLSLNASMAQSYVQTGDLPGLNYCVRQIIARVKAIAGILQDIAQQEKAA